ncbi:unnamed protein product, partial [marine sediment metagenome]
DEAGGLAQDAAGSFEHLRASFTNTTDRLKKGLVPAFDDLSESMATNMDLKNSYMDAINNMTEAQKSELMAMAATEYGMIDMATQLMVLEDLENQTSGAIDSATRSYIAQGMAIADTTSSLGEYVSSYAGVFSIIDSVGSALQSYNDKQDETIAKRDETLESIAQLTAEYGADSQAVTDMTEKLNGYNAKLDESTEKYEMDTNRRILKRAEEMLAADGLTTTEELALLARGKAMGIYTEEYIREAQREGRIS